MNARKPFAHEPGYVCSLRTPFGHAVVYDQDQGAALGAPGRWVVAAYNGDRRPLATVPCASQNAARRAMKDARTRGYGWLGPLLSATTDEAEKSNGAALRERFIGSEETRTHTLRVGDREERVTLAYINGEAQPRMPHSASYMRGWNAVQHGSRFRA